MDVADRAEGGRVKRQRLTPAAERAADRIAARVKGNPKAAARLERYVSGHALAENEPRASDVVREAIETSGLSLQELARRTGVDVAVLSRFMSGAVGISLTTFEKLAPELGLRVVRRRGQRRAPA